MKPEQHFNGSTSFLSGTRWPVWLAAATALMLALSLDAATNVVIWDTVTPAPENGDLPDRSEWKLVPSDPLKLEADPGKASSDPGYYGRDYAFRGDAVVENRSVTAVFWSARGRIVLYAKPEAMPSSGAASVGPKIFELAPLASNAGRLRQSTIVRYAGDEVVLETLFQESPEAAVTLAFGKSEVVEVRPAPSVKAWRLVGGMEYGVVPGFIGDDLVLNPSLYPGANALSVPAENCFMGLLPGEERMLVMTWPQGRQQLKLMPASDAPGKRVFEALEFENDRQGFCLATLHAPGIWHREELKPAYLEKDVSIQWRRPFPARWTTQLLEEGVRTTFTFREAKGQIWRGVPGSYNYPVWFDGETAFFHLSKKVPPKGESLIYFWEGENTPPDVATPVDLLKATLGRPLSDALLDVAGHKLRTHHRRGGDGVHRACTCGCTEAIQAIFESGQEVTRKSDIEGALGDMNYFVQRHVERIEEYQRFAEETLKYLQARQKGAPALKPYLENVEQIVQQIPREFEVQKENMKSAEHARNLTQQTLALTAQKDPGNLKVYMDLLKSWRAMGGAQDYVVAQCHSITRKLFQEAGYGCLNQPEAVALAKEIRGRCRQVLRNPDGYEIWANY